MAIVGLFWSHFPIARSRSVSKAKTRKSSPAVLEYWRRCRHGQAQSLPLCEPRGNSHPREYLGNRILVESYWCRAGTLAVAEAHGGRSLHCRSGQQSRFASSSQSASIRVAHGAQACTTSHGAGDLTRHIASARIVRYMFCIEKVLNLSRRDMVRNSELSPRSIPLARAIFFPPELRPGPWLGVRAC